MQSSALIYDHIFSPSAANAEKESEVGEARGQEKRKEGTLGERRL